MAEDGHWCRGPMLLLDLETDGRDPEDARLVTAALVAVRPGVQPWVGRWLAAPSRPIPAEAEQVHGVNTEYAAAHGVDRAVVLAEIAELLGARWGPGVPVVGHNVGAYDLAVLDRELGRELGRELRVAGPVVDTLLVDKRCDRFRPGSRQLADQCAHYRVELGAAHDAAADALAAGRLAYRLATCRRWPRGRFGPHRSEVAARALVASGDLVGLHEAQVGWHEEAQRGFAEYLRSGRKIHDEIGRRVAAGELSAAEAEAERAALAARADEIEARAAGGWPLAPRPVGDEVRSGDGV